MTTDTAIKPGGIKKFGPRNFRLFPGGVYEALPSVRRLQEGGGCGSPRLHRIRDQVVPRPGQKYLLPYGVDAGKSVVWLA